MRPNFLDLLPGIFLGVFIGEESHWSRRRITGRCADADLGRLGDLVQLLAGRVKQEWTALVLFRIAFNADSVRRYLCSGVKTY